MSDITRAQICERIAGMSDTRARATVCALVGHSRIHDVAFGQHSCARCGSDVAATEAGELTWQDRLLTPEPIVTETL